ncbi:MAG: hypothetical protein E6I57_05940 [Chloroflexi bacterium]|nr:MAG: hypothetical protein E6J24_01605 [Chloroflexota bacterium]TMC58813.1 MAG: hypothetical protein E6J19_01800 [Chloroflexota bacterium]TME40017.1 MAG: hypothetical protein E6I57_05940 [Chloroflexota bacterium]
MSLFRGLAWGIVIGALQIAAGHMAFEYKDVSFQGNPALATAVPVVLLPLAIAWGWTWVSDRWAGRSGPRLLLYTLGLLVASALAFPLDYALYAPDGMTNTLVLVDRALLGVEFVTPVVAFAAILYWAFASQRVRASFGTLAIGYVGGLFLALVLPTLTMGAVAGTAAGHSWQKPRARGAISFLAVLVLLVGVFELRMTSLTSLIRP